MTKITLNWLLCCPVTVIIMRESTGLIHSCKDCLHSDQKAIVHENAWNSICLCVMHSSKGIKLQRMMFSAANKQHSEAEDQTKKAQHQQTNMDIMETT